MTCLALLLAFPPETLSSAWKTPSTAISRTLGALQEMGWDAETPVAWNGPARLLTTDTPAARRARKALGKVPGSTFIPMGLTGASSGLLLQIERDAEVQWAIRNPFKTGVNDAGMPQPAMLLLSRDAGTPAITPDQADTDVPVAFHCLLNERPGIAAEVDSTVHFLPVIPQESLDTRSAKTFEKSITKLRRGTRGREAIVLCTISNPESLARLETVLAALRAAAERGLVELTDLPEPGTWPEVAAVEPLRARPPDPVVQTAAAPLRRGRVTRASRLQTLEMIAEGKVTKPKRSPHAPATHPTGKREFISSMMGEITLSGPAGDAQFSGGRFLGLGTVNSATATDAGSFLTIPCATGKSVALNTVTCFSFESGISRGIRVLSRTPPAPKKFPLVVAITDFSYVQDLPVLVVSATFAWETSDFAELLLDHLVLTLPVDSPLPAAMTDTRHEVTTPGGTLSAAFCTPDGLPLLASVAADGASSSGSTITVGGRFTLRTGQASVVVLLAGGPDAAGRLDEVLSGRFPADLKRELAAGPGPESVSRMLQEQPVPGT